MCSADSRKPGGGGGGGGSPLLPVLALLASQLFTSSWHVLGKHVMHTVPYLAPISYVFVRTFVSALALLLVGVAKEGYVPFPPLFRDGGSNKKVEMGLQVGLLHPSSSSGITSSGYSASIESGNSIGLTISHSNSMNSLNGTGSREMEEAIPQKRHHHHRPRRRKRRSKQNKSIAMALSSMIPSVGALLRHMMHTPIYYQRQLNHLNPEALQIIFAGLAGMLLLPTCYTTGLILTSPTVASVWDGPMIPLGCFCAAVTLGLEKRSKLYPVGQVGSLLLTVGGSIVVLLVDYLGGGHGISSRGHATAEGGGAHVQFMRGNMVLAGLTLSYSATALLQKRLTHYPPLQLTGWMFSIGFVGCFIVLVLDSILGSRITGCNLGQASYQLYLALSTSPTFRYGLLYSAFFVGGACFSINSYASSHLESSVITLFAAMQPPITAVLEWIWEGKGLGAKKLAGMACVLLGMYSFTYIKRIEKAEGKGHHPKKRRTQMQIVHPKKAQSSESNGELRNRSNGSPGRIPHEDV